jgi:hypothetical protein
LGNDPIVHALSDLQKKCDPDVVFLLETHLDVFPAECVGRRLNIEMKIVNSSVGRSDGVLLLWKKEINIQQIFLALNYIDVQVNEGPDKVWRITGI